MNQTKDCIENKDSSIHETEEEESNDTKTSPALEDTSITGMIYRIASKLYRSTWWPIVVSASVSLAFHMYLLLIEVYIDYTYTAEDNLIPYLPFVAGFIAHLIYLNVNDSTRRYIVFMLTFTAVEYWIKIVTPQTLSIVIHTSNGEDEIDPTDPLLM